MFLHPLGRLRALGPIPSMAHLIVVSKKTIDRITLARNFSFALLRRYIISFLPRLSCAVTFRHDFIEKESVTWRTEVGGIIPNIGTRPPIQEGDRRHHNNRRDLDLTAE